jgi:probable rRNA maturation factor
MPHNASPSIKFHILAPFYLKNRTGIKQFILDQFQKQDKPVEAINYIFCSDEYLLELNQSHLQHDTYTDIITFDLSSPGGPLTADIYISVERVRENAVSFKTSFRDELLRVMFHGALHLLGFKDKTPSESTQMRKLEDSWIAAFAG